VRLSLPYQPRTLDDVAGQPSVVWQLKRLVAAPCSCCLLFMGPDGAGKTAVAKALAHDLNVCPFTGFVSCHAASLDVEGVRWLFHALPRSQSTFCSSWRVLLVEGLESIVNHEAVAALQHELDNVQARERLIVVGTINAAAKLDGAILQGFEVVRFLTPAIAYRKPLAALTSRDASGLIETLKNIKAGVIDLHQVMEEATP
jgi:hypothetical protein